MRDVYIAGATITQFGKHPDRSLGDLGREACRHALRDAGLNPADIQAGYHRLGGGKISGRHGLSVSRLGA